MRLTRRSCLRLAPCAALAGCASPTTHFYRLASVPGKAIAGGPATLGVRRVSIPGYVDRDGIVTGGGTYQLHVSESDVWAEPLGDMLQSAMVGDLASRLPNTTVIASGGSIGAPTAMVIEINVQRFDPDPSGRIVLDAVIATETGSNHALLGTRRVTAAAMPAGKDAGAVVATMSLLWAKLADEAASLVSEGK